MRFKSPLSHRNPRLKKVAFAVFLLLAGFGITESGFAQEKEERIDTVIITNGTTRTLAALPFGQALDREFPCNGGELRLILSPSEQAFFKDGILIRYTYIGTENTKRVAELEPPASLLLRTGQEESFLTIEETRKNNHNIVKLHGVPCSVKYEREKGTYRIESHPG